MEGARLRNPVVTLNHTASMSLCAVGNMRHVRSSQETDALTKAFVDFSSEFPSPKSGSTSKCLFLNLMRDHGRDAPPRMHLPGGE